MAHEFAKRKDSVNMQKIIMIEYVKLQAYSHRNKWKVANAPAQNTSHVALSCYQACPCEWDSYGNPMGNVPWDGTGI